MASIVLVVLFIVRIVVARERVAVCVTGQVARWLPKQQIPNLIEHNPKYFFSFFFLFQLKDAQHPVSYNKIGPTDPSKIAKGEFDESISKISNLYTQKNSELANIRFITPYTDDDWKEYYNLSSPLSLFKELDRMTIFLKKNPMILTLYRNQAACLSDVIVNEKEHQRSYDYVYFTREDLYYFHPLNFTIPVEKLKLQRQDKTGMTSQCHLIAKDCLRWTGINMRVEIARRSDAVTIFGSRLDFYKHLYTVNKTVVNPETFELHHLNYHHSHVCTLPVEVLGMTVARPSASHPEGVCFFEGDLVNKVGNETCYPLDAKPKVMKMRCANYDL
eukprot:gene9155-9928_t